MNQSPRLAPNPQSITKRLHKAVLRLFLLLTLTGNLSIAQAGGPIPAEAYGDAGTITYSGFASGSIAFHSSECTHLGHTFGGMQLPYQPRYPEHAPRPLPTPGPYMSITPFVPAVTLGLNNRHKTTTNTFMGVKGGTNPGLSWGEKGAVWHVTFNNFRLWDNEDPTRKTPRSITLNGTVTCLYDGKGREKPITPLP